MRVGKLRVRRIAVRPTILVHSAQPGAPCSERGGSMVGPQRISSQSFLLLEGLKRFALNIHQPGRAFTVLVVVWAALTMTTAGAAEYPTKPIRIVVGFTPGGGTDIVARMLALRLSQSMGQPVVVENKPGANGNIGAELVARSAPDGYTLLLTPSPHVISRVLYLTVSFDPIADFEPVGLVARLPLFVIANPRVPANNLRELIAYAKANPGKLSYGTAGQGTINHLAMELLKQMAGVDILTVNYKGGVPAQTDVIAGHIDLMVATTAQAMPFVRDKKVKALAIASDSRLAEAPEVPTATESGLPGYTADTWQALLAPAATPRAVVDRLNAEIAKALQDPETKAQLAKIGVDPFFGPPQKLAAIMKEEQAKWSKLIRDIGVKAE